MDSEAMDTLNKLPMIQPVAEVLKRHISGELLNSTFDDEVSIEDMKFKIKSVPFKDIDSMYNSFDMGNFLESFKNIISNQLAEIHNKFEIYEQGSWNQCVPENLNKFKNPANVLYLRHYYFAKCLFLYLTCGR